MGSFLLETAGELLALCPPVKLLDAQVLGNLSRQRTTEHTCCPFGAGGTGAGRESFYPSFWSFLGRPRGRIVHSSPSVSAVATVQAALPNGRLRSMLVRMGCFSASTVNPSALSRLGFDQTSPLLTSARKKVRATNGAGTYW